MYCDDKLLRQYIHYHTINLTVAIKKAKLTKRFLSKHINMSNIKIYFF